MATKFQMIHSDKIGIFPVTIVLSQLLDLVAQELVLFRFEQKSTVSQSQVAMSTIGQQGHSK